MAKIRDGFYNDGAVMKYSMTLIPLICVMLFFAANASGSFAPFAKYKFEDGGYRLVATFEHHDDHALQKQVGEFYTDDVTVLNQIKRDWKFAKRSPMYACGYHYFIALLHEGKRIDSLLINIDCGTIVTSDGSYRFNSSLLAKLKPSVRSLYSKKEHFDNITKARDVWDAYSKTPLMIYSEEPNWLKHEGKFEFQFNCLRDGGCSREWEANNVRVKAAFLQKYPGQDIPIRQNGGMGNGESQVLFFEVTSTRAFYDSFDLYPIDRNSNFGKWQPFDLRLTSYWSMPR